MSWYQMNKARWKAKAKEYREKNKDVINDKQLRAYYRNKTSICINGYCGKNPERLIDNVIKEGKMDFYTHKTKKEKIGWLFWFYDGKYSRGEIRKHDYEGWYFKLRHAGARKSSGVVAKNNPRHKDLVVV